MEKVYMHKRFNSFYTKRIDMKKYFETYSEQLYKESYFRKKAILLKNLLDIDDEQEFNKLSRIMLPRNAMHNKIPKSFVPRRRFLKTWGLYDIPSFETNLDTLNNMKKEKREEKYVRLKSSRYRGKVVMEVAKNHEDICRLRSLKENSDYLVCVRVLSLIGENRKNYRPSQEMLVPGRLTLEKIKDRIICEDDYQLANPSIERPDQLNQGRKMDLNKYSMFYIGDTFYIDKRWNLSPNYDYSVEVQKWMTNRGLNPGKVEVMASTTLNSLQIRLGYPYLYMHQGKCEHLIIFTDARLVKQSDLLFIDDYPLLTSFATIKGKYCVLCLGRPAKLCVTDCDELPYDNAFICNLCAYSYLYDGNGQKKSSFKLYKYIDRAAII